MKTNTSYSQLSWHEYYGLYKEHEHPPSTLFHKHISKNLAKIITFLSLKIGISPNGLSIISFFLVLSSTIVIITAKANTSSVILFLVFTQLSYALDCSDGVVARITGKGSKFGAFLDLSLDRFVVFLVYLSIAWRYMQSGVGIENNAFELVIAFLSMALYMHYQISTSLMSFIMPDMRGYAKTHKRSSLVRWFGGLVYEFIDTGIFYFVVGVAMLLDKGLYAIYFYGLIGLILNATLYIILFKRYSKIR